MIAVPFFFSIASAQSQADNQWPTFQGNNQHTGLSPFNTSENSGGLKWYLNLSEKIESSPVISSDGTIYLSTEGGLYAIFPNGTVKWKIEDLRYYAPALDLFGNIYHSYGKLYSIAPDGTERWNFSANGNLLSPSVDSSGIIYVGSSDGTFYSINSDGSERWNIALSGYSLLSVPAIANDGTIYYATWVHDSNNSGKLYAIDSSGFIKWNYTTGDVDRSPTIDSQNRVIITTLDNRVLCINPDGSLEWQYDLFDVSTRSSAAIAPNGTIYIATQSINDVIYALDPLDGHMIWTSERIFLNTHGTTTSGFHSSPVIGSEGTIYMNSDSANLFAYDIYGNLKWYFTSFNFDNSHTVELSSPAIGSDGTVYYGGSDGFLYAVWGYDGPPTANFTAYYPIVISSKLFYFDASESYDSEDDMENLTFRWDFGDNSTGYGFPLNHTYENFGNYSVTLTVTDSTGKHDSMTINITIHEEIIIPPPLPISQKTYVYLFLFGLINTLPLLTIILRTKQEKARLKAMSDETLMIDEGKFNTWLQIRTTPVIWLTSLMIADVITTYIAISGGLGYESNPLAKWMLEMSNGYYIVLGLKFLVIIMITFVAFRIYRNKQKEKDESNSIRNHSEISLWIFTIGVMILTVGNNMLIISP